MIWMIILFMIIYTAQQYQYIQRRTEYTPGVQVNALGIREALT